MLFDIATRIHVYGRIAVENVLRSFEMNKESNGIKFSKTEKGQGFVEYGLLLILFAIFLIVVVALFGETVHNYYLENFVRPMCEKGLMDPQTCASLPAPR